MKLFISRLSIHICAFLIITIVFMLLTKNLFGASDRFWSVFSGLIYFIIPICAVINICGEIAFVVFVNKNNKESTFKVLTIRSVKFLCYLILVLVSMLVFKDFEEKSFIGVSIVILYFIYAIIEFFYFRNKN